MARLPACRFQMTVDTAVAVPAFVAIKTGAESGFAFFRHRRYPPSCRPDPPASAQRIPISIPRPPSLAPATKTHARPALPTAPREPRRKKFRSAPSPPGGGDSARSIPSSSPHKICRFCGGPGRTVTWLMQTQSGSRPRSGRRRSPRLEDGCRGRSSPVPGVR